MSRAPVDVRPLRASDYAQWRPLWDGNNLGHSDKTVTKRTWTALTGARDDMLGYGAFLPERARMAGIIHGIVHPTTGSLSPACLMQDLYVDPDCRGRGAGKALLNALAEAGRAAGWSRLYWFADNADAGAQIFYKSVSIKLDFALHVLPLDTVSD